MPQSEMPENTGALFKESPGNFMRACAGFLHFADMVRAFTLPIVADQWRPPPSVMDQESAKALCGNLTIMMDDVGAMMQEIGKLLPDVFAGVFKMRLEGDDGQDGSGQGAAPDGGPGPEARMGDLA